MTWSWIDRAREQLARPVDASSLAVFRFWFGACMAVEVWRYFDKGWIRRYFVSVETTFPLPGFGWLEPWGGQGMFAHYTVMGVAALCVMLGFCYRPAILTLFLTHLFVFAVDETNYLNHFYLIALLAFLLLWMPADRAWALGPGRQPPADGSPPTVPAWTVLLLRAQLFLVYFYAGIAKLTPDWLAGHPLGDWVARVDPLPLIGPWMREHWFAVVLAWGGLFYDLSVGFLLLFRRTRPFGIAWSFAFHLSNVYLFQIGIFPWLAMGATLIFLEPDWPRQLLARLRRASWPAAVPTPGQGASLAPARLAALPALGIATWLALQVLVPLRHWLFPGSVHWTEEGHLYSWHMKLRDKTGILRSLSVVDPRDGRRFEHDPRVDLSDRQFRKMTTRPRLVHAYVQWLADRTEAEWGVRPRIYVDLWASLNGRQYQPLIDARYDLASEPMDMCRHDPWIVTLTTPLEVRRPGRERPPVEEE